MNQNIAMLLQACYGDNSEACDYARSAIRYLIERNFVNGEDDYYRDLEQDINGFIQKVPIV